MELFGGEDGGEEKKKEIKKIRGSLLSVFPWQTPNSQLMSLMTQKRGNRRQINRIANKQNRKKHFQSTPDLSFERVLRSIFLMCPSGIHICSMLEICIVGPKSDL